MKRRRRPREAPNRRWRDYTTAAGKRPVDDFISIELEPARLVGRGGVTAAVLWRWAVRLQELGQAQGDDRPEVEAGDEAAEDADVESLGVCRSATQAASIQLSP